VTAVVDATVLDKPTSLFSESNGAPAAQRRLFRRAKHRVGTFNQQAEVV
jgi:hypothetical protein